LLPSATSWRERLLRLGDPAGSMLLFGAIGASMIWVGIVLSYSRGALAAALVATLFFLVRARIRRLTLWLVGGILALPTLWLMVRQLRAPGERFLADGVELATIGFRLPFWRAALSMVGDHLALGSGLGTFETAFAPYAPPTLRVRLDHLHNDWLQALAEGGPLVPAALLVLLFLVLRPSRARWNGTMPGVLLQAGVAAGVLAAAVHALVDFTLRIPAAAVLLAAMIGMSCVEPVRRFEEH
jgi:O-antigen ligase